MTNWFICKISRDTIKENGLEGKVSESYLVDALSFAEVEERIMVELGDIETKGGRTTALTIKGVNPYPLSEMFLGDDFDRYYCVKVRFTALDEKSGREKKTSVRMLAGATSVEQAIEATRQGMKGTLADYEIISVAETQIVDIYPYKEKEEAL
jgi:hypothetical protein